MAIARTLVVLLVLVVSLGVPALISYAFGRLEGFTYHASWSLVHGQERTRLAQRLAVTLVVLFQALLLTLLFTNPQGLDLSPEAQLPFGLFALWLTVFRVIGVARALRPPGSPLELVEPERISQDHDGLTVVLPSRPTWFALLFTWLGMFILPLNLLFAWLVGPIAGREVEVAVGTSQVRVSRGRKQTSLPLAGLTVAHQVRMDGTPRLRLASGDVEADVVVGGAPPAQVAWLQHELEERAAVAVQEPPTEEPPPELRALLQRRQTE